MNPDNPAETTPEAIEPIGAQDDAAPADASSAEALTFPEPVALQQAASLPDRADSVAFIQAVRSLRPSFKRREDYNSFICAQMAARGAVPNATQVLHIGGWGSKGDVSADVKAWFAQVARSAAAEEFAVPPALRRESQSLLEQMWALASRLAQTQIEEDRARAQAVFAQLQNDLQESRQGMEALRKQRDEAVWQRDEAARLAQELRAQIDRADRRAQEALTQLQAQQQEHERRQEALRAEHAQVLAHAQAQHQQELQRAQALMQERWRAESSRHAQETDELKHQIKTAQDELQALRDRSAEAAAAAAQQARQMALALDKARQEALSAAQQAIESQKAQAHSTAELAEMRIRMSLLERDLAQERAKTQELQAKLQRSAKPKRDKSPPP